MKTRISLLLLFLPFATAPLFARDCGPDQSSTAPVSWPLEIFGADDKAVVYQPQPESFKDDQITTRVAVSAQPKDAIRRLRISSWRLWYPAEVADIPMISKVPPREVFNS